MNALTLKKVITTIILIVLLIVLIRFAVRVLLPVAIVIIAGYIVYILVTGKHGRNW